MIIVILSCSSRMVAGLVAHNMWLTVTLRSNGVSHHLLLIIPGHLGVVANILISILILNLIWLFLDLIIIQCLRELSGDHSKLLLWALLIVLLHLIVVVLIEGVLVSLSCPLLILLVLAVVVVGGSNSVGHVVEIKVRLLVAVVVCLIHLLKLLERIRGDMGTRKS